MDNSRFSLEYVINNSPLFKIDKENDFAYYKTERLLLLDNITKYYQLYVYPNKSLDYYDLELLETSNNCIKAYKESEGLFLNYLNRSMKQTMLVSKAKESAEKVRGGITLPGKMNEQIRELLAFVASKQLDVYDPTVQKQIAKYLNISEDEVEELILANQNATIVSSVSKNDEGEEVEVFDFIPSNDYSPEELYQQKQQILLIAKNINEEFARLQNRPITNKIISMFLTIKFIEGLNGDKDLIEDIVCSMMFIDHTLIKAFFEGKGILNIREISSICGVSEQSANRTIKKFLEKIKK